MFWVWFFLFETEKSKSYFAVFPPTPPPSVDIYKGSCFHKGKQRALKMLANVYAIPKEDKKSLVSTHTTRGV